MSNVSYTAEDRGYIRSGHSAGTGYNFDFNVIQANETWKTDKRTSRAINGKTQTTVYSHDEGWAITSEYVLRGSTEWDNWREFLSSVRNGESFSLDVYGANASPDNVQSVILDGNPSFNREGSTDYFTISFNVIYNANL